MTSGFQGILPGTVTSCKYWMCQKQRARDLFQRNLGLFVPNVNGSWLATHVERWKHMSIWGTYPVLSYLADWTSGNYLPTNHCSLRLWWILLSQKRENLSLGLYQIRMQFMFCMTVPKEQVRSRHNCWGLCCRSSMETMWISSSRPLLH